MHPYFIYMWFVIWFFGVVIIGAIPIICRCGIYYITSVPITFGTLNPLDIALMGLAFNWTSFNETLSIMAYKQNEDINKIRNVSSIILLIASIFLTFLLGFTIAYLYNLEIIEANKAIISMNKLLKASCALTIASLFINLIYIIKLKI